MGRGVGDEEAGEEEKLSIAERTGSGDLESRVREV